jgi:hypothetical protein
MGNGAGYQPEREICSTRRRHVLAQRIRSRDRESGFAVVDPGQFPAFGNDFTPQIGLFKRERSRSPGNLIPGLSTFWAECAQQVSPAAVSLKGVSFPADAHRWATRVNVCCEVWWSPHYP